MNKVSIFRPAATHYVSAVQLINPPTEDTKSLLSLFNETPGWLKELNEHKRIAADVSTCEVCIDCSDSVFHQVLYLTLTNWIVHKRTGELLVMTNEQFNKNYVFTTKIDDTLGKN